MLKYFLLAGGQVPGYSGLAPPALRATLVFVFHTGRLSPKKQGMMREAKQQAYIQLDAAFSALHMVLQHLLLLRQTAEHTGRTSRQLKGAPHEGLMVLAVQQAEVSEGMQGRFPLPAPWTLAGWGA